MINQKCLLFIQTLHKYIAKYSSFTESKKNSRTLLCLSMNDKVISMKKYGI